MTFEQPTNRLVEIAGDCTSGHADTLTPLIETIRTRHGPTVRAIVYYGSCFRDGDPYDGLIDFYVVVTHYRRAHRRPVSALANRLVPPNVYYLERDGAAGRLRCKYAVIRLSDLEHGVTRGRLSSLWGRFAQPMAIVYSDTPSSHTSLRACCGQAVVTLLEQSLPVLTAPMAPADVFGTALTLSYGGELRTESGRRGHELAQKDREEYARRVHAARFALDLATQLRPDGRLDWHASANRRKYAERRWRLRGPMGRSVSVLRLAKACFTFENAVDYGAWKLERHTGVTIEITPRLRRYPLIYAWPVLWRLYRQGVLR